jgi:hypothetical protein
MQPAGSAPVDWWRVYRDEALAVEGVVSIPVDGIYSTQIPGWPDPASYTMTSVNAAGESAHSNAISLPELSPLIALAVLVPILLAVGRWR